MTSKFADGGLEAECGPSRLSGAHSDGRSAGNESGREALHLLHEEAAQRCTCRKLWDAEFPRAV